VRARACARAGLGVGPAIAFGIVDVMTEHEPGQPSGGAGGANCAHEVLAARLLAAQRLLATLTADPEVRLRLQARFIAICTALRLPGASEVRGVSRLDRLLADARRAQNRNLRINPLQRCPPGLPSAERLHDPGFLRANSCQHESVISRRLSLFCRAHVCAASPHRIIQAGRRSRNPKPPRPSGPRDFPVGDPQECGNEQA
jgi:hypothetical protein